MSRRRPRPEMQFGSDSFLDVVANIVGILIILIVITGLRISKTPLVKNPAVKPETPVSNPMPFASSVPDLPNAKDVPEDVPRVVVVEQVEESAEEPEPEPEPELPPLPLLVPPRELVDLTEKLQSEVAVLREEESRLAERFQQSNELQSSLIERQQAIREQLTAKTEQIDASRKQAAVAEADLELARETLTRLIRQVREIESEPVHVETLQHKITPISRVVNGSEKHYRLEKNRVIEVPVDELCARFREQIERRKDWLAKTRQHQGQVGPIRGFSMQYLVRIESMSELEAARAGQSGIRISLGNWEIIPEPDAKGEPEEVALRRGSMFYQSILGTPADTTLTFWVYPDSYALYRKLQKFTHDHGFSVAARPLPHGVAIAGSPSGSKSASQ